MTLPPRARILASVAGTLLLAWCAAQLCLWWGTPIPWMMGPLLATALCTLAGAPTASDNRLRNLGQWVMGVALGLYFTPAVVQLLARLWWALGLYIVWALVLGGVFAFWLRRALSQLFPNMPADARRSTAFFASAIGGASEMTLLAERKGARADLVAAAHSMRMLIVVVVVPFAMVAARSHWNLSLTDVVKAPTVPVHMGGLALLGLVTVVGGLAFRRLRLANPWFLGPLAVAAVLAFGQWEPSGVPAWATHAGQLFIGVSLGVRFQPQFLRAAPAWLVRVAWATLGMVILSAGFGTLLAQAMALHPATIILSTAPGGATELAITAKALQLGAPIVTALQVGRLVAVLVLVEPVYERFIRRLKG